MNTGMMEGLLGASNSIKQASVSMNVYVEARNKGDEETMNRAMGYTVNHMEQAEKYNKKLEEATKTDQEEAAKKAEAEQAEALAEKKAEKKLQEEAISNASSGEPIDQVQLSEEAKQYIEAVKPEVVVDTPQIYVPEGEAVTLEDVTFDVVI